MQPFGQKKGVEIVYDYGRKRIGDPSAGILSSWHESMKKEVQL